MVICEKEVTPLRCNELQDIKLSGSLLTNRHVGPPRKPRKFVTVVELTYACNLRCGHCHVGATRRTPAQLSLDECTPLFVQMAEAGVQRVYLSGGEPTLHADLIRLVQILSGLGLESGVISNGYLLTAKLATALASAGLNYAGISLNLPDRESYDRFTGTEGAFEHATRALRAAVEAGIPSVFMLSVANGRVETLHRLVALASELGVNFGDERPVPIGRATALPKLDPAAHRKYLLELHRLQADYPHMTVTSSDPLWGLAAPDGPFSVDVPAPLCPSCWHVCVTPDLKVKPCAFSRVQAGNLKQASFADIWNYSLIARVIRNKDNIKGKCGQCVYRHLCGGCRASAHAIAGDFLGEDPLCWLAGDRN